MFPQTNFQTPDGYILQKKKCRGQQILRFSVRQKFDLLSLFFQACLDVVQKHTNEN